MLSSGVFADATATTSEPERPTSILVAQGILGVADLFSVFANGTDLITGRPSKARAYFGIATGTLSIAFAVYLDRSEIDSDWRERSTFFAVAGGLALGLGAFNLKQSKSKDSQAIDGIKVDVYPALVKFNREYVTGIGVLITY
jgi:hypothetical protein